MRAFPFRSILAGSLALALVWPCSAAALAPSKSKSTKPKSEVTTTKDPKGGGTEKDEDAPAAVEGPPRVGRIFIDADGLGAAGPVLAGRSMRMAQGALQDQGVTLTTAPAGPELRVVLTLRDGGGYRVEYQIVYDGKTIEAGTGGFDCQLCTEDELVEKVEALVIQVAPKLVVPTREKDPEVAKDPEPKPKKDPVADGSTDPIVDEENDGLGGKGKAGVALLVVGGLGAIGGVVLVARKPKYFPVGDPQASMIQTTRPPGWALLGGGVAAVVVGAVLLGIDRKQAKQREAARSKPKKAEAKLHPWLGADGAGLGVYGRF